MPHCGAIFAGSAIGGILRGPPKLDHGDVQLFIWALFVFNLLKSIFNS
jgi:hypothetical protein